jgi:phospholipid/cholesterol/gamma-HCH transport system substrate-binding protein
MRRDLVETLIGGVVLVLVVLGIVIGFASSGVSTVEGYSIKAEFDDVSGVSVGTEVRLAGVKVGTVTDKALADDGRLAILTLSIDRAAVVPADSKVRILPEGLLGGSYIAIEPGGAAEDLADGAAIAFDRTQGAINVIDLLGRLVIQAAGNSGQPSN